MSPDNNDTNLNNLFFHTLEETFKNILNDTKLSIRDTYDKIYMMQKKSKITIQ